MDLQKNKISTTSSEVTLNSTASSEVNLNSKNSNSKDKIINFLLDNRDVGQIIIDFFEVENKIKNAENLLLTSEKINYFESVKSDIGKDCHRNCFYFLWRQNVLGFLNLFEVLLLR